MQKLLKKITAENIIFSILLAIVVIVPVIFDRDIKSVFAAPKLFALNILILSALLVWTYKIFKEGTFAYIQSKFNRYLAVYAVVSIVTTIFSTQIYASIIGIQGRFVGLITVMILLLLAWIASQVIKTKKQIVTLMSVSITTAFFLAIYGIMQRYSGIEGLAITEFFQKIVGDPTEWTQDPTMRVFGTLGHGNHFGAYLVFNMMLLTSLFLVTKRCWIRLLLIPTAATMLFATITTASRGALLAFIVGVLILCIFLLKFHWQKVKQKKTMFLIPIIAILIIVGALRNPIWEKLQTLNLTKRTTETITFILQGNIPDRVSWWFSSWEMFKDRPILGHGLSTYKDIYNKYRRLDYRVPGDVQDITTPESTHMEWLNILVSQGMIGLLSYFLLVGYVVIMLMKKIWKNENPEYRYLQLGILAALMTYHTETLMSFGVISTLTMFHLFLGVGASAAIHGNNEGSNESQEAFQRSHNEPSKYHIILRKWKYPVVILLIIFIIAIFQFSYRQYKAEYYFRQAKNRYIDKNWEQFWKDSNAAIDAMPYEYVYYSDFAEGVLTATAETGVRDLSILEDNLTQVLHLFKKALEIGYSQPYIHANLGLTYFTIADVYKQLNQTAKSQEMIDNGVAEYELAITLGPNNPLYAYNLGISLFKLKNYEKAVPYFKEALEIREPFNDTFYYLAASYMELGQMDEAKKWNEKELVIHPESEDAKKLYK